MIAIRAKNKGFTLVELMVGMAISLIIMAGAVYVFQQITRSSLYETRQARATQQLREISNFIVKDVRRSGYRGMQNIYSIPEAPDSDPFAVVRVVGNSCIEYTYNRDEVSGATPTKYYGIRWDEANNQVDVCSQANSSTTCDACSQWNALNDQTLSVTGVSLSGMTALSGATQMELKISAESQETDAERLSLSVTEVIDFMNPVSVTYE